MVLICDAGNTHVKIGCFNKGELVEVRRFSIEEQEEMRLFCQEKSPPATFICSVLGQKENELFLQLFINVQFFNSKTKLPIEIHYQSNTLGKDRIANAVAINSMAKTNHAIAIDIGTCIKFDVVVKGKGYIGGSISPGIRLRYQALHNFTKQLPLIERKKDYSLIGSSTEESIVNGVMQGIRHEINGFIQNYESELGPLTFFVTGGDAKHFDFHSKNDIFVFENLTLIGLYQIYLFNA